MFLGYEPFCAQIKSLFGADVNSHDVKALFRKIAANPEAEVDWSEVQLQLRHVKYNPLLLKIPAVDIYVKWGVQTVLYMILLLVLLVFIENHTECFIFLSLG